jgi:predicted nucleic acid-binding protein
MARNVLVDAGFIVALLNGRDEHHLWSVAQVPQFATPWHTCEAVLSEVFHLLGSRGLQSMTALIRRKAVFADFNLADSIEPVLRLLQKYSDVPMSLADACLVRMTEVLPDCVLLTTDSDFRVYRRSGRQTVPCVTPD